VFKAHRRLYHSTLGLRVIKKKKKNQGRAASHASDARAIARTTSSEYGTYKTVKARFWPGLSGNNHAGSGAARAEDSQGTPTRSHISPSIL